MFKIVTYTVLLAILTYLPAVEKGNAEETIFSLAQAQEDKYFDTLVDIIPPTEKQIECLAMNIYHEARNETRAGKMAVAMVTLNRVKSDLFPNSVCEVVYQGRISRWHQENTGKVVPIKNQCQFSWYCDGKSDKIYEPAKYEEARELAFRAITGYNDMVDITDGALWYHADYVKPYWAKDYKRVGQIDTHIFYKERT
jgi:spore germination cell wall hydrolase CwlJ-like protein